MKPTSQQKTKRALDQYPSLGIGNLWRSSPLSLRSGDALGMSLLCRLKNGALVVDLILRHPEENSHPDVCQTADRHAMALALRSFALVVGFGPRFAKRGLPGKLMQHIAQRLHTGKTFVRFGKVATLEGDRSCACQFLYTLGILIPTSVIAPFGKRGARRNDPPIIDWPRNGYWRRAIFFCRSSRVEEVAFPQQDGSSRERPCRPFAKRD